MTVRDIPRLIHDLYEIVDKLESLFPGRKFTPDGHLVGSIGEVMAAHIYGLELLPGSSEIHDARSADGRLVQIKATQTMSVALRSEPEHLLVLLLKRDGSVEEIYNGRGGPPWESAGGMQKNGQRSIRLSTLRRLMAEAAPGFKLPCADI